MLDTKVKTSRYLILYFTLYSLILSLRYNRFQRVNDTQIFAYKYDIKSIILQNNKSI